MAILASAVAPDLNEGRGVEMLTIQSPKHLPAALDPGSSLGRQQRNIFSGLATIVLIATIVWTFAQPTQASEDDYGGLPDGEGRDEVYVICSGCHSIKLVVQQGLTRDSWQESLEWMVDEQGMPEMDPETHTLVLDYLSDHLGIDHRPPR